MSFNHFNTNLNIAATKYGKCRYSDNECMVGFLNNLLKPAAGGIPELGVDPTDPILSNKTILIRTGSNTTSISLAIHAQNVKIIGFSDSIAVKAQ